MTEPNTNPANIDWDYIRNHAMRVHKHLRNHYNDLVHRSACDTCMAYFLGEQMAKEENNE
jgi:hypothetical protein